MACLYESAASASTLFFSAIRPARYQASAYLGSSLSSRPTVSRAARLSPCASYSNARLYRAVTVVRMDGQQGLIGLGGRGEITTLFIQLG